MTQVSDERLAEMLAWAECHDASLKEPINIGDFISLITELQFLRSQPEPAGVLKGNDVDDRIPIAATDNRAVDWVDVSGWGVFKGHAIPVDVARFIAEKINFYFDHRPSALTEQQGEAVTEGKEAMLALEVIERLIRENIYDNGTEINRMLIDGVWHTGPVVDASFRILKGLHKIASAARTTLQKEQADG
jgi:hypothetical protein